MQEQEEYELQVGESLRLGDYIVTVVEVDADEVSFRIDPEQQPGEVRIEDGVVRLDH